MSVWDSFGHWCRVWEMSVWLWRLCRNSLNDLKDMYEIWEVANAIPHLVTRPSWLQSFSMIVPASQKLKKKKKKQYIKSWLRIMSEQLWDPAHSASHWDVLNLTCRCVCACMHVCGWQECAGCCNWEIRSQQKARVPTDTQRGDETEKDNPQSNSFISSSCICQVCSHWPTTSSWAPFEVVKYPWWHFGHFYHYPSRKCMSIT